ncbi:MAG TPA: dethiobiotin synthase [Chthoniobacterales bacterium]
MSIFVSGTDTGVGKTRFTVWLLQRLRERGIRGAGYKPICCGDREDAVQLQAASYAGLTIDEINPTWLRTPAAPLAAALEEKRAIDLARIREGFVRLSERVDFVAVEGVGGWMVPIAPDYFTSDLAAEFALPVVVVALNRLGCLNHTLLTVRAIESNGVACAGVIVNDLAPESDVAISTNAQILRRCLSVPILEHFEPGAFEIHEDLRRMLPELAERV